MKKAGIFATVLLACAAACGALVACAAAPVRLSAPQNLRTDGNVLLWDEVENATGYVVYVQQEEHTINQPQYDLSSLTSPETYVIEVLALGDGKQFIDSEWTKFAYTVADPSDIAEPLPETLVPTQNLAYTLLPDGSGYQVSRGRADLRGRVVIPDSYKGLPVKKIAYRAFDESTLVITDPETGEEYGKTDFETGAFCNIVTTEFRLPDGLEEIGDAAFRCCGAITEIKIPNSVQIIGKDAFEECIKLQTVVLPQRLAEIPMSAFWGCKSLTTVKIPASVSKIGNSAFYGCHSLAEIELPENMTSIEDQAFYQCRSLANIKLPDRLTYVGGMVFRQTPWFQNHEDGFVCVADWCIGFNGTQEEGTVLEFPAHIKHVAKRAFLSSEVKAVRITGSVVLEDRAFESCKFLTDVYFEADVTSVPNRCFSTCTALKSVTLCEGITAIGEYAFEGCSALTDVVLPSTVQLIGRKAFSGSALQSVTLCEGITAIGKQAFWGCRELTKVDFPSTLQEIGDSAFAKSGLTNITIPGWITSMGKSAFGNSALQSVTLCEGITAIGEQAF